jgi:hypothetical protein
MDRHAEEVVPILFWISFRSAIDPRYRTQTVPTGGVIMPTSTAIFWPLIAQVALVHLIYVLMLKRRYGAVRAGTAKVSDFWIPAIEPEPSATVARNLINQFELPVLFFLVCVLFYITAGVNHAVVAIAWLFVLSRFAHAYVHVTSNRLRVRQRLFVAGFVLNVVLWVLFAFHISGF